MSRVPLPLIGSGVQSSGVQLNPSRLINFTVSNSFGVNNPRTSVVLKKTPGTIGFTQCPVTDAVFRGWVITGGVMYTVFGSKFYSINNGGSWTEIGTVSSETTRCSLVSNGLQILISTESADYSYTFATLAFAAIVDPDLQRSNFKQYHRGRGVYTELGTGIVWVSALNDFTSWSATAFQSAELDPEAAVCAYATSKDLFIFGVYNIEAWVITPDVDFPYLPNTGIDIPYGCVSAQSIASIDKTIYFLGRDRVGQPMLLSLSADYKISIVGDEALAEELQNFETLSDAVGRTFQLNDRIYYSITFPSEQKTYLYDIMTKTFCQWTAWSYAGLDSNDNPTYELGRHLWDDMIVYNDRLYIADYRANGRILELTFNSTTDLESGISDSIYSELITPVILANHKRVTLNEIEVDYERGTSDSSEAAHDEDETLSQPLFSISLSKDGGRTFNYSRDVNFGYQGQYDTRAILYNWGVFRAGAIKLTTTHPSNIQIYNLWADLEIEEPIAPGGG